MWTDYCFCGQNIIMFVWVLIAVSLSLVNSVFQTEKVRIFCCLRMYSEYYVYYSSVINPCLYVSTAEWSGKIISKQNLQRNKLYIWYV